MGLVGDHISGNGRLDCSNLAHVTGHRAGHFDRRQSLPLIRLYIQGPKKWFAKCDKHYPSRSGQTSLATAVANFTKPRTSHFFDLCTMSVFKGVCEGATFPALYPMTARWVPVEDRNRDD